MKKKQKPLPSVKNAKQFTVLLKYSLQRQKDRKKSKKFGLQFENFFGFILLV